MVYTPHTENTFDFVDLSNMDNLKKAIKPNTKICWIETPTNPTLKCVDIQAVSKICKAHGILLCIDNTFMSPVL
jgi:cystathionine beta-lyase/cystathionine gamma-synthase